MSINDNINFLENIKQGFKRAIPWNKYTSEVTKQPKTNNLDYMIDPKFRNINMLFVLSFENVNDYPRLYSDKYYMSLVEIKDFNVLIDNNPFFDQSVKDNQETYKNWLKCEQKMIIRQEKVMVQQSFLSLKSSNKLL